jgi:DNA polymerase-1
MDNPFTKAIAAAASAAPQGAVPVVPGRILLVDGDGLAYYCAGNDDTDAGEARRRLINKVETAAKAVGAERTIVLLTASGSHKGHRYAVARVKPYQGQRTNSRRPKNWEALRNYMTGPTPFEVDATMVAEADDLFGWYAYNWPDDVVIYTQDKDMRMLPGLHLDWVSHRLHKVGYTLTTCREHYRSLNVVPHDSEFNDLQYGPRWFWLQMLHGDGADNIPGLPRYVVDGKAKPFGEVTAGKLLANENLPHLRVAELYRSYYGERWLVEMMEQAVLLWMRRVPDQWDDCMNPGGPLESFNDGEAVFAKAYFEIEKRVREAQNINDQAQSE